ncbi:MAG: hypothetical protein IJ523_06565 [Succinivibrionaceae bacterium]|nr:hypothetical protein [Succinivibrionaceae bacterium]
MSKSAFPVSQVTEFPRSAIHCRFSTATMRRLEEIATATGQHLNKTVATLVDMILPFVVIETVSEPHQKVFVNLPEGGAQK